MKHKHNWIKLLPYSDDAIVDKIGYFLETRVFNHLDHILVCTECGATGHRIKSNKGGVRRHDSDYFLKKSISIANRFDVQLNYTSTKESEQSTKPPQ